MAEQKYLTTVENIIGLMKEEIKNISPLRLQKHYTFICILWCFIWATI